MTTAVVLTTHNEAQTIAGLVHAARAHVDRVYVVDEGSGDATCRLARDAGAAVFSFEGGIGPCQRHGWEHALNGGAERVVQFDAGGSHYPFAIRDLLGAEVDLALGSRFVAKGLHEGPWWRRAGSRLYGRLLAFQTGTTIRDWTSGYRALTAECAEHLVGCRYRATMHGWQAEALRHALDAGFSVQEVPIRYSPSQSALSWAVVREAIGVLR